METFAGMARFWMCHWQIRDWKSEVNPEGEPISSAGSNSFRKRGVSVGDVAYIVSQKDGQLYLGGRMPVRQIASRSEAVRIEENPDLYDAEEWILDPTKQGGTPLRLHRRLAPALTKQLRFLSRQGLREPFFRTPTELDKQALRGTRELTPQSAALLDRIIDLTDPNSTPNELLTVTADMLREAVELALPEEVPAGSVYSEGSVEHILVNRYERDARARRECIQHYGTKCSICRVDLVATYGEVMRGFIHVHHIKPLSTLGPDYQVDPVEDLRPVCPNCHAVLHRREPAYEIDEVRGFLAARKGGQGPR
jgi:hypothetical protein